MEKKNEELLHKNEEILDEKMSRRAFLSKSGKLVGLGLLAHFSLIGNAFAGSERKKIDRDSCSGFEGIFICNLNKYTCTTENPHKCNRPSAFDCQGGFKCTSPSPNKSNCLPLSFNEQFE